MYNIISIKECREFQSSFKNQTVCCTKCELLTDVLTYNDDLA